MAKGVVHVSIRFYKGFTLSEFQSEAIDGILNNENVIVSTHTGNGKTLVADFAVNECYKNGWRVIYTAPIKALSNQKYRQFCKEYGEAHVGLITGDMVINQYADIIVATTEILRNMLYEDPERIRDIRFIILDEIHYLGDEDRGTVWEEVVIFKNPEARIIGLSATIPNSLEICDWIKFIHGEDVRHVFYPNRIVGQKHYYFDKKLGKTGLDGLYKNYAYWKETRGYVPYQTRHTDFVRYAIKQQILPVLFFVFSRKQCEEYAMELSKETDLLEKEEKIQVERMIRRYERDYPIIRKARTWADVKRLAMLGIGFHHAGLLPIIKQFMEEVFSRKLCKVLYATETFAVGINYPVKTVCFVSLRKFDGKNFRILKGGEYLQMAGRAGRRGIDKFGMVFTLADYRTLEHGELFDLRYVASEPVESRFTLGYNTVLNLLARHDQEGIDTFFRKSFANFQYIRRLDDLKQEYEKRQAETGEDLTTGCNAYGTDRCIIVYNQNREKLKMFERMLEKPDIPARDKELIQAEIAHLRECIKTKPVKCNKSQRLMCQRKRKDIKKAEKTLRRYEKRIGKMLNASPEVRFREDMEKKKKVLLDLGYITEDGKLTPRGVVCSSIHIQPLLVTELIFEGFFCDVDASIIGAIAAGIALGAESGSHTSVPFEEANSVVASTMEKIHALELIHGIESSVGFDGDICSAVYEWCEGADFFEISAKADIPEGDFVSVIRRAMDLLRQIRGAIAEDRITADKISEAIRRMDRGVVKIGL